jgi:hypothetical protein
LTPVVTGTFVNGGPTLFARKPVMLLVSHFLQHILGFLAAVALEFANLIFIRHLSVINLLVYANGINIHLYFFF